MLLVSGAVVLFLLFIGLGFISHILWLGVLLGPILVIVHMHRSGVDTSTRGGRLNRGLLTAVRDYLDDVLTGGVENRGIAKPRSGSVMTPDKIETAQKLSDAGLGANAIAEEIGVSRSTVYRYTNDDQS